MRTARASAIALVIVLAGCLSALDTARVTVASAATLAQNTGEMIIELDKDNQEKIEAQLIKDGDITKAKTERDLWRAKRAEIRAALKIINVAVVSSSIAVDLATQGRPVVLADVLGPLLKAVASLRDALKVFGIALPGGV